ncbi:putative fructosyl amino acid oxidasesarcosine oxidase [Annulohypoxylon nitens]|nr:putative fructosyl amino acid oxidasesarcosine oxidase [Annulohypoxylon nitens]
MGPHQASQADKPFARTIIIIGAGVFGLSTALAIADRHPSIVVKVIDRLKPPVLDGTSVDTTRCIRADYKDPVYAKLAKAAQTKIREDPELNQYMYQQGMTFACDGEPDRFTELWKAQKKLAESLHDEKDLVNMPDRESVFQRLHGKDTKPPSAGELPGGKSRWNMAYCNLEDAFIDAEKCIEVYYNRCLTKPNISFRCGSPVDHIRIEDGVAKGVMLESRTSIDADVVLVAAGAWSGRLVNLEQRIYPIGHEVAWIKLTTDEQERWEKNPITTNLSTGLNMFPPYRGEIKILRRSPGYKNTVVVPDPEDQSKTMEISYPRTIVDSPSDVIPLDAEKAMRENLREIMPSLADRPFDRTKICWICTTPTADFLVAPHPRIAGIHLATGGSAHAWKFLPVIGDLVVDSIEGVLSAELKEKWGYERGSTGRDENAPRMDGQPEELRDVVRNTSSVL